VKEKMTVAAEELRRSKSHGEAPEKRNLRANKLKVELAARKVRVVALDLPTAWMMATKTGDEFTSRMFEAINGMLLDMLAAIGRKDYEDRRRPS
jgi:DNA invertase Pin-like site-specific DNA recombinase